MTVRTLAQASAAAEARWPEPVHRPAHSHDEFSPLAEVVVGTARGACIPDLSDRSAWLNLYGDLTGEQLAQVPAGPVDKRVVEESEEDLGALAAMLSGLGVRVHRPAPVDHTAGFATPHWSSGSGLYGYCPRDLALIVGSAIIECPSPMRARYHELDMLRELFAHYLAGGSAWLAAPRPQLGEEMFPDDSMGRPRLGDAEPAFEAANILRCGRDLFYLVSNSGNEAGLRWLRNALRLVGGYTVHAVRGVYPYTHIDSTIALIRPGLVLLNPERLSADTVPAALRGWDVIWCPPMQDTARGCAHPLSSPWIGMNLLMVDPGLAVVDAAQTELIAALERHGVDVLPHTLRHARALGGGLHCVTLDTVRTGALETYCD
jgi:glycine amidinotransferase